VAAFGRKPPILGCGGLPTRRYDSTQKKFRCGIRKAQSLMRELKLFFVTRSPAAFGQLIHFRRPFVPQIKIGCALEFRERPAGVHPQAERSNFPGATQWRQFLAGFNRAFSFFKLVAVELGVRPVFCANTANVAGRAGAESVERTAAPVIYVVPAGQ
jgi:hypothetical protein